MYDRILYTYIFELLVRFYISTLLLNYIIVFIIANLPYSRQLVTNWLYLERDRLAHLMVWDSIVSLLKVARYTIYSVVMRREWFLDARLY